jgi:PAS domain S-box-containing protein
MIINDACMNYPFIILLVSPEDGDIIWANKKAEEIYGYNIDELCKMNIDKINVLKKEQVETEMMKAENENRNYFHFPHRTKGGKIIEMEVNSYPTVVDDKKVLLSLIKPCKECNYFNNVATKFVEGANDAVVVVDQSMRIIMANNNFISNYEDTSENIIGNSIIEDLIRNSVIECKDFVDKLLEGKVIETDAEIRNNKKEIKDCNLLGIPTFFRDDFFGAIISIRNKTVETLKEKEKTVFFEKALEDEKAHRKAKEDFFARMSYDMKTPVSAVIGMAKFGIEAKNNEKDIDYFKQINESSEY